MKTSNSKYLTNERFNFTQSEIKKKLIDLKNDNSFDLERIIKIEDEDFLLGIKYRSYKKCKKQIVIALLFIIIGFIPIEKPGLLYFISIIGLILLISSFFGLISNSLTKKQIEYIRN